MKVTAVVAATLLTCAVIPSAAQDNKAPLRVRVFSATDASGFVDANGKDRAKATATLARELVKPPTLRPFGDKKAAAARFADAMKKWAPVEIVENAADSDVSLEVTDAHTQLGSRSAVAVVETELKSGDYSTKFREVSGDVGIAAAVMTLGIRKWLDDNYDTIIAKRPH